MGTATDTGEMGNERGEDFVSQLAVMCDERDGNSDWQAIIFP